MCGICGIVSKRTLTDPDRERVLGMSGALIHRGPDSGGMFMERNVAFAMRRLKIIDLAGGDQPLYSEDGMIALVANGEIYNHVELREALGKRGHSFRSGSDCETIIHLYEEKGEACLEDLRGMFAFALYDGRKKTVFIARDRMGEKPLYYRATRDEIVFASELKSLIDCMRGPSLEVDATSVDMYFRLQYVPEPHTCLKGVKKLPAAHSMTISLNGLSTEIKRYWSIDSIGPVSGDPPELIRGAFEDMGRLIIRADVPMGVALSGGMDSSAIAVYAAKHYDKGGLHAFSVGYPGRPHNDERGEAGRLARRLGLEFHELELRTDVMAEVFPELVYYMDDPIADIAAFGYYSISRLAADCGVPVVMTGIGGDELFWGYGWVRRAVERNLLKRDIRSGARGIQALECVKEASAGIIKKDALLNPLGAARKFLADLKGEREKFHGDPDRLIFFDDTADYAHASSELSGLYSEGFRERIDEGTLPSILSGGDWEGIPVRLNRLLMDTWLVSNCVALGDRMSMAASVEARLPFLDHKLIELVIGLRKNYDGDWRLGSKKWLEDAMRGIIPDEVFRRKKRGFTPPSLEWYTAVVRRYSRLMADGCLVENGIFGSGRIERFLRRRCSSRDVFLAYKAVLLEIWLRRFIRGETRI